jgi:hypothetical protein
MGMAECVMQLQGSGELGVMKVALKTKDGMGLTAGG